MERRKQSDETDDSARADETADRAPAGEAAESNEHEPEQTEPEVIDLEADEIEPGDQIPVLVSVDDDHLESFDEVIAACEVRGLHVVGRLDLLGVATGSVSSKLLDRLTRVPGVKAVESDEEVRIAPPDADVQ